MRTLASFLFFQVAFSMVASGQTPEPVSGPAPSIAAPDQISLSRSMLTKYYEIKELISKERTDWELGREILEDRISLIGDQVTELKEKTGEEETKITKADEERETLGKELADLKVVEKIQSDKIVQIEQRVALLARRLPGPLQEKVRPLLERLPEKGTPPEDIKLSISQRFQNVLGILNEVNKFQADVFLAQERRAISGGREAEVSTLYLGLGQAFYAGSGETAKEAGTGVPGPEGFVWDGRSDEADELGLLIRINNNEAEPVFVPVSVSVK